MSDKNLPIKLVLQRTTDTQNNNGGGKAKFFGEVTPALQAEIIGKFNGLLDYYQDVFEENEFVPAVGKITVKPEAIAKSHKPNDLCRYCQIIGSEGLNEIYIKITKKDVEDTITQVQAPPSQKFRANLTAINDIQPIHGIEKISEELYEISTQGMFDNVKGKIKVKLFDFDNDFDNSQIMSFIMEKLSLMKLPKEPETITYGDQITFIKVQVESFDDVIQISEINGVKSVGFFQEYSQPLSEYVNENLEVFLHGEYLESDIRIGLIDGGISDDNPFLRPYIDKREIYVPKEYQNSRHATFIASIIQYGNKLNEIEARPSSRFRFVDIVAVPNSNPIFGPVDSITEDSLMEIIKEVMEKHAATTKIWSLSLGVIDKVCTGAMSDLGIFLDYIQDKYAVQIIVSIGNLDSRPLREWPAQTDMDERDRIISPADSVRAITVGSIALLDSADSIVRSNEPSPFSRRGPGANFIVKPDVVDYGGNISKNDCYDGLGMKGMDLHGNIIESIGTSFSTPRITQKFAAVYDEMAEKDLLLAKAMVIHSARMNSRDLLDQNPENIKYYGFGMPSVDVQNILQCSKNEITLVFRQKVLRGTHLEMHDFPYPPSLMYDGKCFGEIGMTLAYNPVLDKNFGKEYCRTNIDASFGICKYSKSGKPEFKGCVPLESTWDEKYEKSRVENGFKWSPIKSYYRKISNKGIKAGESWKIRIDMIQRNGLSIVAQEFVLIITIKDPLEHDIYSEVVNGLREKGYITRNLETRQQVRQRQ